MKFPDDPPVELGNVEDRRGEPPPEDTPSMAAKATPAKRKKMTPTQARKARAASAHGTRIKKVYGLSKAEYAAVLEAQGGLCAICKGARPYRLAVDHNHKTGEVRGLLCKRCNRWLLPGCQDTPAILNQAAHYLLEPPVRDALGAPRYVPTVEAG